MRYANDSLKVFVILFAFILPWSSSEALDTFEKAGVITAIGYDQFTVRTQNYRFAPGAKIVSSDPARSQFSDFEFGDQILFRGKILNGVHYVDVIIYETPIPS